MSHVDLSLDYQSVLEKRHKLEIDGSAKFNKQAGGFQSIVTARMDGKRIYHHKAGMFFEKRKDALLVAKALAKDGAADIERVVRGNG